MAGNTDGIFDVFLRGNFRLEVDSDVISGVVIDLAGVKTLVELGDSRSNRSRDMRLSASLFERNNSKTAAFLSVIS